MSLSKHPPSHPFIPCFLAVCPPPPPAVLKHTYHKAPLSSAFLKDGGREEKGQDPSFILFQGPERIDTWGLSVVSPVG